MEEHSKTPKTEKVPKASKEELEAETEVQPQGKYSLGKFKPMIVTALLALAVSYFLITIMAVPKGTYNNAVGGLSARMAAIEVSVGNLETGEGASITWIQELEDSINDRLNAYPPLTITQDQIDALATKVNSLEAQIAGLNIPTTESLTGVISSELAEFDVRLYELECEIDALKVAEEEEEEEDEPVVTDDYTLWTKELYSTSNVTIDYTISPTRVEEEGDYIIMVYLYNYELVVKNDVVVDVIFSPKTGDRVIVDEEEVYLDSTRTPFYGWFGDIVKRSDGTTRRMVFTSEKMAINAAREVTIGETTGIDPGRLTLRLEFTLAYK